ncbi:unnamed protein product [Didymodactylos carnosus]|uniref:LIM zinc-binding domain-containing protein n=1 Tax=Didymodactylos carnosus TaxID=1234261 RepID=A0A814NNV0_9BILA|nr:unnamed protein product [Didymodactylos carnosus]CAF1092979.1 unnamed protein product [Didymodactylos carnosus]CAF3642732.1 unnamed protein product [Didymodactylos carnosus]CAF3858383.1 unnamed protein product [Didymodactylos carnosus]
MPEVQKSTTTMSTTQPDGNVICNKCNEKILNVMTADDGKVYHPHCFNCSDCGKTLAGGFFYKSKPSNKPTDVPLKFDDSIRYCETCYKKIAPKCDRCTQAIEASSVMWNDKKYHESCFTCWGNDKEKVCNKLMKDEPVYPDGNKWYCRACYDKLDTGRKAAGREILEKKCKNCHKGFTSGTQVSEFKEDYFHPDCLTCTQCGKSICQRKFYHQEYKMQSDNKTNLLCEQCHYNNSPECAECKEKILDGQSYGFEGKSFHGRCFMCAQCKTEIGTNHFSKSKDGKYLCARCTAHHSQTNTHHGQQHG